MKKDMKKIFSIFMMFSLLFSTSCTKDSKIYDGPGIKHFPETSGIYFVEQGSDEVYKLPVGYTIVSSSDVTMGISVDTDTARTTAIEGKHFDFITQNPVLKAGEVITNVEIKGNYDNLDTPKILNLTVDGDGIMQKDFELTIQRFCPYVQDDFVGTAVFKDSFIEASWPISIAKGDNELELVSNIHSPIGIAGNDIIIKLDPSDKSNFTVTIDKQEAFDSSAFGLPYGMISMAGSGTFSACDRTMVINIEYTVAAGSFGTYTATIVMD